MREKMERSETLQLQKTADACNRGKISARNVQDASVDLFFRIWLERSPVETMGVVISAKGEKFFDVYVPQFAIASRIVLTELPFKISGEFDKEKGILKLDRAQDPQEITKEEIPQNGVHASVNLTPESDKGSPISVTFSFEDSKIHVQFSRSGEISPRAVPSKEIKDAASGIMPLQLPCQISRFSKVPVMVWARRCKVFGRLMDVKVDLLIKQT